MRLGVFGGAFDPVHTGHLVLASECRQQLALDAVWLVPSGSPPHKDPGGLADAGTRVEMLELATAGDPGLVVSRIEIDREGVSYTVDTLETIAASDPGCELFLLLGADSVADLANWYQPERICELARVVAVNRGGTTSKTAVTGCRVEEVTMPAIDVSSRDIRHRIHQGRSIRHLVPRAVEAYLDEHALYNDDSE
ncbi:MAG TPA: nicotinic acid mononucleotide adenylyltransferase [Planctomycetaceae bacterium]|nr:nicotinic acid mononucleotide adenylyltransferase [Planctomycetaceae bacterium]